jgi:hypothetical protein
MSGSDDTTARDTARNAYVKSTGWTMSEASAIGDGFDAGYSRGRADERAARDAEVQRLTEARDEHARTITAMRAALERAGTRAERAEQIIADAPHAPGCATRGWDQFGHEKGPCNCWKSRVEAATDEH